MITRLLFVAVLCLSVVPAAADDPAQANRLLVEAMKSIKAAETEQVAARKQALLESALAKLNQIVDDHPASDLAVKLITGQQIGNLSLENVINDIETLRLGSCLAAPDFTDPACLRAYAQDAEGTIEDGFDRAMALAHIARALTVAGDDQGATETLAKALAAAKGAMSLVKLVEGAAGRAQALTAIAVVHALSGDIQGAWAKTVQEFLAALKEIENPDSRAEALALNTVLLASSGNVPEVVLAMAQEIEDVSLRINLFTVTAVMQALAGNFQEALTTAEIGLSTAENTGDPTTSDRWLALDAIVLALSGQNVLEEVRTAAKTTADSPSRVWALIAIALAEARTGNAREALMAAREIQDSYYQILALAGIALMQAKMGNVPQGLATAKMIEDPAARIQAFAGIAVLQADAENLQDTPANKRVETGASHDTLPTTPKATR